MEPLYKRSTSGYHQQKGHDRLTLWGTMTRSFSAFWGSQFKALNNMCLDFSISVRSSSCSLERFASDHLEQSDVSSRQLDHQLLGRLRQHLQRGSIIYTSQSERHMVWSQYGQGLQQLSKEASAELDCNESAQNASCYAQIACDLDAWGNIGQIQAACTC